MSEPYVDCTIIGGGIFGSIIAKKLRAEGMQVIVVDNDEKLAGSKPAACLMKPSWYSSMGKETWQPAMRQLEKLYEIEEIEFRTKVARVYVDWINPVSILAKADRHFAASLIRYEAKGWSTYRAGSDEPMLTSKYLILAAGVWCNKILSNSNLDLVEELSNRTGTSFRKHNAQIAVPEIAIWAPYRQTVAFNIAPDSIWVGDGTANKKYTDDNLIKSQARCANFLQSYVTDLIPTTGHRPYVKDAKPCYLKEHAHGLWVVTGGAKNGTIAAGWAAHTLGERLC